VETAGKTNQPGHAHIVRVIVLHVLFAAQGVDNRGFQFTGKFQQLFMRARAAAAAHQGDIAGVTQQLRQFFQFFFGGRNHRLRRVIPVVLALSGAALSATSPGKTTTETPRFSTALRMAIASTCGICSGVETSSQ
jgi:hypothetical protein